MGRDEFSLNPIPLDRMRIYTRPHILLVPQKDEGSFLGVSGGQKSISPLFNALVSLPPRRIVDNYAAVSASVERHAQRLETLLPRCVPQLQRNILRFARFPILHSLSNFDEISPDCRLSRP